MKSVAFTFDGRSIKAIEGQTVAIALWAAGIRMLRNSPKVGEPRGMLCGMGICQECALWIDGTKRESCMTVVQPNMKVTSQ